MRVCMLYIVLVLVLLLLLLVFWTLQRNERAWRISIFVVVDFVFLFLVAVVFFSFKICSA